MKKKLALIVSAFCSMLYSQSQPTVLEEWKATVGTQNFFYKNVTQTDASGFIYVAGATLIRIELHQRQGITKTEGSVYLCTTW